MYNTEDNIPLKCGLHTSLPGGQTTMLRCVSQQVAQCSGMALLREHRKGQVAGRRHDLCGPGIMLGTVLARVGIPQCAGWL